MRWNNARHNIFRFLVIWLFQIKEIFFKIKCIFTELLTIKFSFSHCEMGTKIWIDFIHRSEEGTICLSRSDLKTESDLPIVTRRTNYNQLFPVDNGRINCTGDGKTYNLTDLCYDSPTSPYQDCTLPTGQKIQLNPA